MPRFTDKTIETIRSRLTISDVMQNYAFVENRGGSKWVKCPFHGGGNERTASCKIDDSRGTFYCFGCHESGDIFSLVMKKEGLDFSGAVELLAKKADKICVAYEGMGRFFPEDKIIMTGNPVRQALLDCSVSREDAIKTFGLDPSKKTILIIGGSLGARTMNESVLNNLVLIKQSNAQFIWQTGKYYSASVQEELAKRGKPDNVAVMEFISDMAVAYRAADLVVSRSGAGSISELQLLGKAAILVPSPNVAEDHQTKNTLALTTRDAALYVKDADAVRTLIPRALNAVADDALLANLSKNIKSLALPDAAKIIAQEVVALAEKSNKN